MSNKKTLMITSSSLSVSPYVYNYLKIFKKNKYSKKIDLVIWDRLSNFKNEEVSNFETVINTIDIYRDGEGIRRKTLEYIKYANYLKKNDLNQYEDVIIFSPQLYFFMCKSLLKNQGFRVILDIRDYHKIAKYIGLLNLWYLADVVVVSSPYFKEFIDCPNVVINHNFNLHIEDLKNAPLNKSFLKKSKIKNSLSIGSIGAFRDLKVNIALIEKLKNNKKYKLLYHGEGVSSPSLAKYLVQNKVSNVVLTGAFEQEDIGRLYDTIDISNVLRDNKQEINKYALPNRLYDSLYNGKPLLCNRGNYMSEIIEENHLGIVLDNLDDFEIKTREYFETYYPIKFRENANSFLREVSQDNREFERIIIDV